MDKEKCLDNFKEMIKKSWTYEKLTDDERKHLEETLNCVATKSVLKGNYLQRWRILQAIYTSFIMALNYEPLGWRE